MSYSNITAIIYTGSNLADTFTLNLGGFGYAGSLTANTGNGADTITILGATGSSINGPINISEGLGQAPNDDTLNLNGTGATGAVVFGGSIQALHGAGTATLNLGNTTAGMTTSVHGNLTISDFTTINLGGGTTSTVAATVGGNLTVLDANEGRVVTIGTNDGFTVQGNVNVSTGTASDVVTLRALSVSGSTQFNLGEGANAFTMGTQTAALATASFNGNFGLTEGNGANTNNVVEGMAVGGDVNVKIGDGNSTFVDVAGSRPVTNGSFNLTAGNGNDTITLFGDTLTASLAGNATIKVGNGNNTVLVSGAPAGTLNFTCGAGTDSLTLTAGAIAQVWNVDLNFGIKSDTLALTASSVFPRVTLAGSITGSGVAINTFTNVGFTLSPTLLLTNFP